MRVSLVPALIILLLLGLAFLLPRRSSDALGGGPYVLPGSARAGPDVAAALLELPPLDLVEPPGWVLQRGAQDATTRNLDRLAWGGHGSLQAAFDLLTEQPAGLSEEVLARLDASRGEDTIQISKLLALLAHDPRDDPAVVDLLTQRALAESDLVAKAALRVLGQHPSQAALGGILFRLHDEDPEVHDAALAALAERVRRGDTEALAYLLQDLEERPDRPEQRALFVLAEVPTEPRIVSALWEVVEAAPYETQVMALGVLLHHRDARAIERVEQTLRDADLTGRLNALLMAAEAGCVLGTDVWQRIADGDVRQEVLLLMSLLQTAVRSGDASAPLAMEILERIAQDPTSSCQAEAIDVLFGMGHAWALERTRDELRTAIGAYLAQCVDRIEKYAGELGPDYALLARDRLAQPDLGPVERALLCRLMAHVDPQGGADLIVALALDPSRAGAQIGEYLTQLVRLSDWALRRLEPELGDDRAAALYVYVTAEAHLSSGLPGLERIVLDEHKDPVLRQQALDAIVRVHGGPREAVLRRVTEALDDPAMSAHARLLFWNYL